MDHPVPDAPARTHGPVIRNRQDFWAGVFFAVAGLGFALGALAYPLGRAARMGPGYFPGLLGLALLFMGLLLIGLACRPGAQRTEVPRPDWRAATIVLGAVALFAGLLPVLGIYPSIFLLVFVSSLAAHDFNPRVAAAVGVGMMGFVWLVFVQGLGLVFPMGLLG